MFTWAHTRGVTHKGMAGAIGLLHQTHAQLPLRSFLWAWGSDSQQGLGEARGSSEITLSLPGCVWLRRVRLSLCARSLLVEGSPMEGKSSLRSFCLHHRAPARGLGWSGPCREPLKRAWTPQQEPSFHSPSFERRAGSVSPRQTDAFHSDEQQQSWDCLPPSCALCCLLSFHCLLFICLCLSLH